ncbi:MAG: hypothetical protein ABIA77_01825 [Candidatus Omnitrophota bacterium]
MVLLVKLLSIMIIVYGCMVMLRPGILEKNVLGYVKKQNNIYVASAVKAAIGILLMIASSACRIPWVVLFFGAASVFSGIAVFLVKKESIIALIEWLQSRTVKAFHLIGTLALFLGILLALAA